MSESEAEKMSPNRMFIKPRTYEKTTTPTAINISELKDPSVEAVVEARQATQAELDELQQLRQEINWCVRTTINCK